MGDEALLVLEATEPGIDARSGSSEDLSCEGVFKNEELMIEEETDLVELAGDGGESTGMG